jgi:hypothetical protein
MKGIAVAAATVVLFLTSLAAAQECGESVVFTTSPGTIELHHNQSEYNCCSWIGFDVLHDAFSIEVVEWEHLNYGGCDCHCCMDTNVEIGGLEPGEYTVTLWKNTEHGGMEFVGVWTVEVSGESEPYVYATFAPCESTDIDGEHESWGAIKGSYRNGNRRDRR